MAATSTLGVKNGVCLMRSRPRTWAANHPLFLFHSATISPHSFSHLSHALLPDMGPEAGQRFTQFVGQFSSVPLCLAHSRSSDQHIFIITITISNSGYNRSSHTHTHQVLSSLLPHHAFLLSLRPFSSHFCFPLGNHTPSSRPLPIALFPPLILFFVIPVPLSPLLFFTHSLLSFSLNICPPILGLGLGTRLMVFRNILPTDLVSVHMCVWIRSRGKVNVR